MSSADGSAVFSKAIGMDFNLDAYGMGVRCKRYCLLVEDMVVKYVGLEERDGFEATTPAAVLPLLNEKAQL